MTIFSEGLFIPPPPCFQAGWFYMCCSKNPLNTRLGHVGTKFGEAHRSQIFITALTFSVSAWILLAAAVFTLSTSPSLVSSVPFFQGTISMTNATTNVVSELNYYGGLHAVVVEDCTSANGCPPHVQAWPSVDCGTHFENCDQCRDSISDLVVPTIMAFLTQVLQILGDVQRSTVKGDFHFMKMIGIVTGLFGLVSTLAPLNAFANACVTQLQPSTGNVTIDAQFGAAYFLLTIATWLKVVDVVAHVIVPVPEKGYWEPGNDASAKGVEISMTELTEQKWEKCSVEVGSDAPLEGTKAQPTYSKV